MAPPSAAASPTVLQPLTTKSMEPLQWREKGSVTYPGLVRLRTIADAGALLHACLNAFFVPYRSNQIHQSAIGRREMVQAYRETLARRLTEPIDPANTLSPTVYECLARGKMKEMADIIREYHVDIMQGELNNPDFILDDKYLELIANELSKDVYILNAITHDVHIFDHCEIDMYYKNRPSIVVLYLPGHFELVGVQVADGDVMTHFSPRSPFITMLRKRYEAGWTAAVAAAAAAAMEESGHGYDTGRAAYAEYADYTGDEYIDDPMAA
jgi:hypothetical protein